MSAAPARDAHWLVDASTFYDASYAAVAQRIGRVLVSADADLLDAGLAQSLAAALD